MLDRAWSLCRRIDAIAPSLLIGAKLSSLRLSAQLRFRFMVKHLASFSRFDGSWRLTGIKSKLGNRWVCQANDIRNAIAAAETGGKRTVLLRLKSGDVARFVTLPVGRG